MASLYLLVLPTMLTKSSVCIDPIIYFGLNPQVIFWPCCSLYKTDPDIYSLQSGSSVLPSVPIGAVSMAGKRFNNLKTWSHHNSLLLRKDSFFNRAEPQEVLHCTFEEVSWLLWPKYVFFRFLKLNIYLRSVLTLVRNCINFHNDVADFCHKS